MREAAGVRPHGLAPGRYANKPGTLHPSTGILTAVWHYRWPGSQSGKVLYAISVYWGTAWTSQTQLAREKHAAQAGEDSVLI